jgi:DNA-binding NtrC family response regulator
MAEITNVIREEHAPKQLHIRRLRLGVVDGPDAGQFVVTDHDVVRIGSKEGNHLRLTDDTVSRNHAEITRTQGGVLLRDLGSTNGTFVGPVRIKEVYLGESRRFRVGKSEIEFTPYDEVIDIVATEATRFEGLVGRSVSMREVFSVLERIARTELTVLVTGETGTGKELVSRAIHDRSTRRNGPFVVFDCGAVARNLVESELFGHEKGAFTGAVAPRAGVFEQAHGGTIFLDELGELPLELQPALLRVLEQREVRRVGDRRVRPVDVRVVAATNRDLGQLVAEGQFRQDLFYRLAVVEVHLPPLRERREDFALIVDHILATAPFEHRVRGLSAEVERVFQAWHWPGNIRELRNVVLRAIPFSDGPMIGIDALPDALRTSGELSLHPEPTEEAGSDSVVIPGADRSFKEAKDQLLESFERYYLEDLLQRSDANLSKAARLAGVDRKTIARMLKRHGIK